MDARDSPLWTAFRSDRRSASAAEEGAGGCPSCGEAIVVPLDPSAGLAQSYVEDCAVCCRANVIEVAFSRDGQPPHVDVRPE